MGIDRNRSRIEKIESSLTPKEIIASWVEQVAKFDSIEDYMWSAIEGSSPSPLLTMLQEVKSGITRGLDGRDKNTSNKNSFRELQRKRSSEVLFLFHLFFGANNYVRELLSREQLHNAALQTGVQAISERVCPAMQMFELWKGLADTPYPLDANTAAAVSSAIKNDAISFDDLVLEIAGRESNHFTRVGNQEESSESTCERLKQAVHDLCQSGLVERGSRVGLRPSLIEFLADPPLVDGVWIDRVTVELAEFAALLSERGIKLAVPADPHPLAPSQLRRSKEIPGKQEVEDPSEDEIANARAEATTGLSRFTGRTKQIDTRPYIHLDDYRAWSARKAGDDLEVTEGVIIASWNAWVEASGDTPELAGVRVSKLDRYVEKEDFFLCENPERRRGREKRASLMTPFIIDSKGVSELQHWLQASRVGICRLLTRVRSTVIATERVSARYFSGQEILCKLSVKALNELAERARLLADNYNGLVHYINAEDQIIFDPELVGRIEKIDINATEQAAKEGAGILISNLVSLAKAEMLSSFGESEKAAHIWRSIAKSDAGGLHQPSA